MQLGVVLFEKLGLDLCRRESGHEVDNDYLAEIDHPIIQSILDTDPQPPVSAAS